MHQSYKRLCTANPKLRLSPAHFVEQGKKSGGFFDTPLIRVTADIDSLGLKNDAEREEFIKYAAPFASAMRCWWNVKLIELVNLTRFQMISLRS